MNVATRSDELVSNRRLREAFLERQEQGLIDARLVAIRLGWIHPDGRADATRVLRVLGLAQWKGGGNKKAYLMKQMSVVKAGEVCRAIGLDPHEVGL